MIRNSQFATYFTQAFILSFRCVVPLGSLYFLTRLSPSIRASLRLPWYFEIYLLAELSFYAFVFVPLCYVRQRPQILPSPRPRDEREKLWQRCLDTISNPESFISLWTGAQHPKAANRRDVIEWLSWALLNKARFEPTDEEELQRYVDGLEALLGRKLPLKPNTSQNRPMRVSVDHMSIIHRPLMYYLCGIGVSDLLSYLWMAYHGYQFQALTRSFTSIPFRPQTIFASNRSPAKHTAYWYRAHTSNSRLPILYIHGIGILHTYLGFFSDLAAAVDADCSDGQIGIIILDIAPISFRMTHVALSPQDFVEEVSSIVSTYGWQEFVLVGNSKGTSLSLQLLRSPVINRKIADVLMIDPVVFLLHCPEMVHNFLRRSPVKASEWQLWYFASTDIGASHTLARRFLWSENILWKEDMVRDDSDLAWRLGRGHKKRRWTVILSRDDIIVDAFEVGKYLTREDGKRAIGDERSLDQLRRDVDGFASATKPLMTKRDCDYTIRDHSRSITGSGNDRKDKSLSVFWFDDMNHAEVFDYDHTRKSLIGILLDYTKT